VAGGNGTGDGCVDCPLTESAREHPLGTLALCRVRTILLLLVHRIPFFRSCSARHSDCSISLINLARRSGSSGPTSYCSLSRRPISAWTRCCSREDKAPLLCWPGCPQVRRSSILNTPPRSLFRRRGRTRLALRRKGDRVAAAGPLSRSEYCFLYRLIHPRVVSVKSLLSPAAGRPFHSCG
jgi:hypothetical protein